MNIVASITWKHFSAVAISPTVPVKLPVDFNFVGMPVVLSKRLGQNYLHHRWHTPCDLVLSCDCSISPKIH